MSTTTVTYFIAFDGVGTEGLTVLLSEPESVFGVKRNDNDATVVADGTAMTEIGGGYYAHTFTDPAADLTYTGYAEFLFNGETYHIAKIFSGSSSAAFAVTVTEAKAHIRVDISDDDTLISGLIVAANDYAQMYTRRQFVTDTLVQYFTDFPDEMELLKPPLQSVTTIKYLDTDGNQQTLADSVYDVDTTIEPGIVRLAFNQSWPSIRNTPNSIIVTYVAGYGDASDVPQMTKQAILLLIGHWYENREDTISGVNIASIPRAVDSLLWATRLVTVP